MPGGRLSGVQMWAGEADDPGRYDGALTFVQAVDAAGHRSVMVMEADPMIRASREMVEDHLAVPPGPVRLGTAVRIEVEGGPLVYVVRGYDAEVGTYYLSWPD